MKSKLFLTVLLLAAISTIGISQDKQPPPAAESQKAIDARKAERERIYNLPLRARSLVGVKGIRVLVGTLREDARSTGLTAEQVKSDIELKLRQAGIKVNSKEERVALKDAAYIYVNINTASENDSSFRVFSVFLGFRQQVMLVRSPFVTVAGNTWDSRWLGLCPESKFPERARQAARDGADRFINDYRTANPEK